VLLKLLLAAVIGSLLSVGAALAVVSSQAPEDLEVAESILTTYGER
jgi:hypothetical protein